jgi:hypothetical protein
MPVIPCQRLGLCRTIENIENFTRKSKTLIKKTPKFIRIYGILIVALIEVISLILAYTLGKSYKEFWYDILVNIIIFTLVYKNYCDKIILKYCSITRIALKALFIYFAFNILVLTTGLFTGWYYLTVSTLLLGLTLVCTSLAIYRKNNK